MGMDYLGVPEMGYSGTGFCYEGKGGTVGCNATSFHLAKKNKGLFRMALIHSLSYIGIPHGEG